jgi:hypothetical protein
MQSAADVPTWLGILMFVAGLAITVAMAKLVASREQRRNGLNSKSEG